MPCALLAHARMSAAGCKHPRHGGIPPLARVLPAPQIATSPILVLVGVLIFASAVGDLNWEDYTEGIPALVTVTIM